MIFRILLLGFWLLMILLFTNCNSKELPVNPFPKPKVEIPKHSKESVFPPHSYGGWYCPDNILGFPAIDLKKLTQIPVVTDRLPTKEETYEGKSLIFIDRDRHPDAKPLGIPLPSLARYYSEFTKKNELIVVIQAVTINQDSIVGFRFLNGGNGSAWLHEVSFISEEEHKGLDSTPFVSDGIVIQAFPKII